MIASRKPGLASTASSSKIKEEPKDKVKKEEKDVKVDTKSTPPTASKPKATGKLDWSRAKTKETKKAEKENPRRKSNLRRSNLLWSRKKKVSRLSELGLLPNQRR